MSSGQELSPASPPSVQNLRHASSHVPVYAGAAVAIVLVCVGGWLCYYFRSKLFGILNRRKGKLDAETMKLRHFSLEELKRATDNFSQECLVGFGAFGNVYRGIFPVEGTLAIKKPHHDTFTSAEEFRNEVRLLSTVKHRNLVGLVGFCQESGLKGAKILVYEYVTNGSLLDYIMGRGGRSLTWRQRVNIAIGAAKGIAHLHEGIQPSIIHRDIKPSNILLGERFEPKVSDFGLVRSGPVGDQSHVSSLVKGTPGYLDPAYCASYHLTPFTDVYSFGVILLQLVAARPAVESGTNINSHITEWARPSIERGNIEEILDTNLLLEECNIDMMLKMGQLGLRCVVRVPKERPTMTQVWQELESALNLVDKLASKRLHSMSLRRLTSKPSLSGFRNKCTTLHSSVSNQNQDLSQSMVSVDGIRLQRFHVDMDSVSLQSASLRCLDMSISIDDDFSVPRN